VTRRAVAAAVAAVIAAGFAAAFLLLRNGDEDTELATISNRGTPVEMEIPERLGLARDLTGEAVLIAERGGLRFLRLPRADGSSCWATGERRSGVWSLTAFACETGFERFPDPKRPVIVLGQLVLSRVQPGVSSYSSFAGFAADGVNRIAVIDSDDRLIQVTNVVDNVFFTPDPPADVKRPVALDATGEIIWRGDEARIRGG
jgi:hypothetical protein